MTGIFKRVLVVVLFPIVFVGGFIAFALGIPWALGEYIVKGPVAECDPFHPLWVYIEWIGDLIE